MRAWGFFSVVCVWALFGAPAAHADPPTLTATGIFGNDTFTLGASNEVVVRVETDSVTGVDGELRLWPDDVAGAGLRAVFPLRMGPSEAREIVVPTPTFDGAYRLNVALVSSGRTVTTAHVESAQSLSRTFVILADPPRVRAAADAVAAQYNAVASAYERVSVGVVGIERRSGDPRVPRTHFGWAGTALMVASAQTLERLDRRGLEALITHIEAGGAVVVFPRDGEDVNGPAVRTLTGPLVEAPPRGPLGTDFLPPGAAPCRYDGARVIRAEAWGTTIARGFGSVHLACFDGNAPEHVHADATRRLIEALRADGIDGPHPLFRQGEASGQYAGGSMQQIDLLRRALDANEGARPVLPFIAILLVVYVVLVGPLGFRYAEKKGRPTLALLTTPLLAFACLTVMLVTGAVAKGFRHRARSVALVEVVASESRAIERRITGIFFGRPASPDLVAMDDAMVTTAHGGVSGGTSVDVSGERSVVRGFRGGLWSTRLLRVDRALDLGGAVTPTFDGTRLVSVTNGTRETMQRAVVIDGRGVCHRVGTIAPGATRAVSVQGATCAAPGTVPYNLRSDVYASFARDLGLARREVSLLNGLAAYAGALAEANTLTVYARLDDTPGIETSAFPSDRELRLLRVVLRGARRGRGLATPGTTPTSESPSPPTPPVESGTMAVDGGTP